MLYVVHVYQLIFDPGLGMGVDLFSYLKTQHFQICAKIYTFHFSNPSSKHHVQQKAGCIQRLLWLCRWWLWLWLSSCVCKCRPGSKGIMPAGPSAFCRKAEGWHSFSYHSVSNDAITKKSQKAAVSWQWFPCHALNYCWGSISIEEVNWSRKGLAVWGRIFTWSLPGCTALWILVVIHRKHQAQPKGKLCYSKEEEKDTSGNETEIKFKRISVLKV